MLNATQRFSSRVADYIAYRPGYPQALIPYLARVCRLGDAAVIADVGSGTGILTQLLLQNGYRVYGVEPNKEMREAGEQLLRGYPQFTSINGTSEATTLENRSVDLITVAQAFHWFDPLKTRVEFARVLKPGGRVALIWNVRRTDGTPFMQAYEQLLLEYCEEYGRLIPKHADARMMDSFFGSSSYEQHCFAFSQSFDLEGLKGRLMSSSYAPQPGHPLHSAMMAELERIFRSCQVNGQVCFEYDTRVFWGVLAYG